MSLKELFSKEGRRERALQKNGQKAGNAKIKPDERRPAIYSLLEEIRNFSEKQNAFNQDPLNAALKSEYEEARHYFEESVTYLLRRFTYNYDTNMVVDEEEKNLVYDNLVHLGERILPQVRQHLKTSPTLSVGLRLITESCSRETVWQMVSEILKDYEPGYERDPSKKIQLMTFLGEFHDARTVDILLPFLGDHDETVRFTTVESLLKQNDERAREPLLQLLTNVEEESFRIKNRIIEGFVETGWLVKGFRGTIEKLLPDEYLIDGKGKIKLKKARE